MAFIDFVLGRRLANREQDSRKIGWFEAVPAMGLDGLGSASYGPEAALAILIPLGAASLASTARCSGRVPDTSREAGEPAPRRAA